MSALRNAATELLSAALNCGPRDPFLRMQTDRMRMHCRTAERRMRELAAVRAQEWEELAHNLFVCEERCDRTPFRDFAAEARRYHRAAARARKIAGGR